MGRMTVTGDYVASRHVAVLGYLPSRTIMPV